MLLYCIKQNLRWCYEKLFGFYVVAYNGKDVIKKRFVFLKNALNFSINTFNSFSNCSLDDITIFNRKNEHIADFFKDN